MSNFVSDSLRADFYNADLTKQIETDIPVLWSRSGTFSLYCFFKICHTSVCQPLIQCKRLVRAVLVLSFHTAAALSYLSSFINFSHFTMLTNTIRLLPLRAWPQFNSPAPSSYLFLSCLFGFCESLSLFWARVITESTSFPQDRNLLWIFILSWCQGRIFIFPFPECCQRYERIPAAVRTSVFATFVHRPMDKGTSSTVDQNSHLPFFRRRRNWN